MKPRYHYTPEQAMRLLSFFAVKIPGSLEQAEKTLRESGLWPEDDE